MIRLVAALFVIASMIALGWFFLLKPTEKVVQDTEQLLAGKTEIGSVVNSSRKDIATEGQQYEIDYGANGQMVVRVGEAETVGFYEFVGSAVCRALEQGNVRSRCRIIYEFSDGIYEARGASSGTVRYRFTVRH